MGVVLSTRYLFTFGVFAPLIALQNFCSNSIACVFAFQEAKDTIACVFAFQDAFHIKLLQRNRVEELSICPKLLLFKP